ncbi:nodulation efficiency protein NfeD [Paenibacillus athensensis]|uniref:Uncharacterized protein n=1 Tax=Paenibacillus athensensis TaxID=1967502 RepID=A0A4Y8PRQ3_9BACL|nr:NfeD family protein [Paenibacillus athensensis]MCD1261578.1 nodulation efficiency protein NfeD [Paenibacillus athensensis]
MMLSAYMSAAGQLAQDMGWMERVSAVLTHPVTVTALLLIGIVGIALEMLFFSTGLFGLTGLIGFGLYFLGFYWSGAAGFGDLAIFAAGFVLLLLELVVPSFGVLTLLGAACLVGGVLAAAADPAQAGVQLGVALAIALVVIGVSFKYLQHRGVWHRLILKERLSTDKGFTSNPDRSYLLGAKGMSLTPLRPSGTALIGSERVDVVTEGSFVTPDSPIVVVRVEGTRVVVQQQENIKI